MQGDDDEHRVDTGGETDLDRLVKGKKLSSHVMLARDEVKRLSMIPAFDICH